MDNDRSTFKRRLGIYLMGVSIGLMLLGIFHMQRKSAEARQAQIRAQQQGQQPGQQPTQQAVPTAPATPSAVGEDAESAEVRAQRAAEEKIKAEQQNPPNAGDSPGGP